MTLAFDVPGGPTETPSPGAQTVGPPSGPPNAPLTTRLVHDSESAQPQVAAGDRASVAGEQRIAAYPLLGWSADGRQLFLVGPGGKVDSLAISTDGVATGVSTVFDPASLAPGCQVAQTLLSPSGDFFVVSWCANTINVVKVHDGTRSRSAAW